MLPPCLYFDKNNTNSNNDLHPFIIAKKSTSSSSSSLAREGFKGANNTHELHVILTASIMIRRLKKDILRQLPPKRRFLVKSKIQDEEKRKELRRNLQELKLYEEIIKHSKNKKKGEEENVGSLQYKASDFVDGEDDV